MQGGKAREKARSTAGRYPVINLHMEYTSQYTTEQIPKAPFNTAVKGSSEVEYQGAYQAVHEEKGNSHAEKFSCEFIGRKVQYTIDPGCKGHELFREGEIHFFTAFSL